MYDGEYAFSQPCTSAVARFIMTQIQGYPSMYLTLHSYGQLWMAPWGYTKRAPLNKSELVSISCVVACTVVACGYHVMPLFSLLVR